MAMTEMNYVSGGGGNFTSQEFTNVTTTGQTLVLNADFPIKYVIAIIGNTGTNGYMMLFFDVSNDTKEFIYWKNSSYWNYETPNSIFTMSNNNKTVTYEVISSDFYYKTMLYAFG